MEAVGANETDLRPGDEVFGSSWTRSITDGVGTFAEFTVAPADQLVRKLAGLAFEEAAASVMSGLTALLAVRDVGRVEPGKRILINGASGGVGSLAAQVAKVLGAYVTGVQHQERRVRPVAQRRSRHRLHRGGIHPGRTTLRRGSRQRA